MCKLRRVNDLFDSLQRMRARDELFGTGSGRGILEDAAADWELAQNLADDDIDDEDALDYWRLNGNSTGDALLDLAEDSEIASAFEDGGDLGDAISDIGFFDSLFE